LNTKCIKNTAPTIKFNSNTLLNKPNLNSDLDI